MVRELSLVFVTEALTCMIIPAKGEWGTLTFAFYTGSLPTLTFNQKKNTNDFWHTKIYLSRSQYPQIPRLYFATNDVDKNKQPNC